jgi:hypothetical protein
MMAAEHLPDPAQPKLRWYQYRLGALLILAVVVAIVLPHFLPVMRPSPLFDWPSPYLSGTMDPLERVLPKVLPKAMKRGHGGEEGKDTTSQSGRWYSKKHAWIQCSPEYANQMMHDLRTEMIRYIESTGSRISEEAEDVAESRLTGFRFVYTYGDTHRGNVKVDIDAGQEIPEASGDADPAQRLRLQELRWDIEEVAGVKR